MTLLVVGCGDLGGRVARAAAEAGERVFGARRRLAEVPAGVEALAMDVTRPATLRVPEAVDRLVYSVAAPERTERAYRAAYADGLRHVLAALPDPGSVRVVFVSSTAVYGERDGAWVRAEEEPLAPPEAFNGRVLLEAEAVLRSAPVAAGTSLRLGGIYGPGRTRLVDSVRSGRARRPPTVQWTNRIHVEDAARAVLHVLALSAPPRVLDVVDTEPTPRAEVLAFLAERLGVPLADAPQDAPPEDAGKRVASDALAATGFTWRYPSFREGYAALLGGDVSP